MTSSGPSTQLDPAVKGNPLLEEAGRRRTFAIISHPDAGKTTLTEKLLLYGQALNEAGSVQGRPQAQSHDIRLDGPREAPWYFGLFDRAPLRTRRHRHQPARHPGPQRLQRRHPAGDVGGRRRGDPDRRREGHREPDPPAVRGRQEPWHPLITFINKCDRPGIEPSSVLDHIESTLDLLPTALTWPVGEPGT
ncbi:MAG: hypothetical protein IPK93_13430 [Solirubrobacterales bacterium]|nr:hypothetical protein [Solirubrobacterales bacterium]